MLMEKEYRQPRESFTSPHEAPRCSHSYLAESQKRLYALRNEQTNMAFLGRNRDRHASGWGSWRGTRRRSFPLFPFLYPRTHIWMFSPATGEHINTVILSADYPLRTHSTKLNHSNGNLCLNGFTGFLWTWGRELLTLECWRSSAKWEKFDLCPH